MENKPTVPSVNVSENKDGYHISVAVPGRKKDDFHVDVNGRLLTISVEAEHHKEDKNNSC